MGATAGGLGRREFLGGALAGTLLRPVVRADEPPRGPGRPGVITRQKSPDNLEYPFWTLDKFLTPNEQFYVRTHFEVPQLGAKAWRLKVEGGSRSPSRSGTTSW